MHLYLFEQYCIKKNNKNILFCFRSCVTDCSDYYKFILSFVCGSAALLGGLVTLFSQLSFEDSKNKETLYRSVGDGESPEDAQGDHDE